MNSDSDNTAQQADLRKQEDLRSKDDLDASTGAPEADMTPLASVGLDLRTARVEKGLELAVISRALKIRADHLTALEEGRAEALPGRTYAVGFVRSYATYLGLDANTLVQRFKEEIAGRHDMAAPLSPVIEEDEPKKVPQGLWIVAILVVVLVVYGGYQLLNVADKTAQTAAVTEPPSLTTPAPAPVSPPAPQNTAAANPDATDGSASPATDQANAAAPDGTTKPADNSVSVPSPAADTADANSKPQELGLGNKAFSHVQLTVVKPIYVSVNGADGRLFLGRNLKPGDIYHVPNIPGVTLSVSDGSAVSITLEGKRLGVLKHGGVQNMPLDDSSLTTRFSH